MTGDERTLAELRETVDECTLCDLSKSRTHLVFGDGSDTAELMFVGEGPGRVEDQMGLPFVGPAGKLLDRMLEGIGIERKDVYIANVVKCRPPGNRDPLPIEHETCNPYLQGQFRIINPRIICALGRIAAGVLMGDTVQITRMHGNKYERNGRIIVPVFHPAAALRSADNMRMLEHDFDMLRLYLDEEPPPPAEPTPAKQEEEQLGLF
jgi:uracil-DNA glycosylase